MTLSEIKELAPSEIELRSMNVPVSAVYRGSWQNFTVAKFYSVKCKFCCKTNRFTLAVLHLARCPALPTDTGGRGKKPIVIMGTELPCAETASLGVWGSPLRGQAVELIVRTRRRARGVRAYRQVPRSLQPGRRGGCKMTIKV